MASLRALGQNWKLKLLAFGLAVLLWVVVSAEQVTSNWIPVPLQVVVAADGYVLEQRPTEEVQVRFSGPGRELWDVVIRRPPLRLVVSDVNDTLEVVALEPRMVQIPNQLAVNALDVNPGQVTLEFTRVGSRTLPVAVRLAEALPAGWVLADSLTVEPRVVTVSGASSRVDPMVQVTTRPLPLEPADSAFAVDLAVDTANLRGLSVSPRRVRVSGRVERVEDRTIEALPVDVGPGLTIRPTEADVLLRGPRSAVRAAAPADFRVVVSIDSIPAAIPVEGLPVPVRVEHPHSRLRAEAVPATVRLYPYAAADSLAAGPGDGASDGPSVPAGTP